MEIIHHFIYSVLDYINCSCKRKILLTVPDTTRSVITGDHVRQVTFAFKTKMRNKCLGYVPTIP